MWSTLIFVSLIVSVLANGEIEITNYPSDAKQCGDQFDLTLEYDDEHEWTNGEQLIVELRRDAFGTNNPVIAELTTINYPTTTVSIEIPIPLPLQSLDGESDGFTNDGSTSDAMLYIRTAEGDANSDTFILNYPSFDLWCTLDEKTKANGQTFAPPPPRTDAPPAPTMDKMMSEASQNDAIQCPETESFSQTIQLGICTAGFFFNADCQQAQKDQKTEESAWSQTDCDCLKSFSDCLTAINCTYTLPEELYRGCRQTCDREICAAQLVLPSVFVGFVVVVATIVLVGQE